LITISTDIKFGEQLEKLILDDNLLRELPIEIGSLKALRVLSCHNNCLKQLPETLGNLTNLAILNVSANKIRFIPKGIS
jgi:Leucine-rich repeat (LRR) protein